MPERNPGVSDRLPLNVFYYQSARTVIVNLSEKAKYDVVLET